MNDYVALRNICLSSDEEKVKIYHIVPVIALEKALWTCKGVTISLILIGSVATIVVTVAQHTRENTVTDSLELRSCFT